MHVIYITSDILYHVFIMPYSLCHMIAILSDSMCHVIDSYHHVILMSDCMCSVFPFADSICNVITVIFSVWQHSYMQYDSSVLWTAMWLQCEQRPDCTAVRTFAFNKAILMSLMPSCNNFIEIMLLITVLHLILRQELNNVLGLWLLADT